MTTITSSSSVIPAITTTKAFAGFHANVIAMSSKLVATSEARPIESRDADFDSLRAKFGGGRLPTFPRKDALRCTAPPPPPPTASSSEVKNESPAPPLAEEVVTPTKARSIWKDLDKKAAASSSTPVVKKKPIVAQVAPSAAMAEEVVTPTKARSIWKDLDKKAAASPSTPVVQEKPIVAQVQAPAAMASKGRTRSPPMLGQHESSDAGQVPKDTLFLLEKLEEQRKILLSAQRKLRRVPLPAWYP